MVLEGGLHGRSGRKLEWLGGFRRRLVLTVWDYIKACASAADAWAP